MQEFGNEIQPSCFRQSRRDFSWRRLKLQLTMINFTTAYNFPSFFFLWNIKLYLIKSAISTSTRAFYLNKIGFLSTLKQRHSIHSTFEIRERISIIVWIKRIHKCYDRRLFQNCWKLKGVKYSIYWKQTSI